MEEKLWSALVISGVCVGKVVSSSGGVGAHVKNSLYSNYITLFVHTLSEVVSSRGRKHLSSTSPQTLVRLISDRTCLGC